MFFNFLGLFCLFFTVEPTNQAIMSAPKLEDLPKVADDLKTQLESFNSDKLKDTVTQEKIVLPTAEGSYLQK